jgi:broad specificity phosphatase PhoE
MIRFISHPEVVIDPQVPVPEWGLSARGRERLATMLDEPWVSGLVAVWSSLERKAIETAEPIAARCGLTVHRLHDLHENDRSATGFLPPDEFERVADEFFAEPTRSVRGWETAQAAQRRIVGAVRTVDAGSPPGPIAIAAHGGVGTLLFCHLAALPISRAHDQRGAGNIIAFERGIWRLVHGWRPIDSRARS